MKVQAGIEVRFRDIDSMGHVNNAVYLSYFEQARMKYFKEIIQETWNWKKNGILVARHEIDYKLPIQLNDKVTVNTWCESIGKSSLVMAYEVIANETMVCTLGKTVLVCFDYELQQKIEVPTVWKEKMKML